MTRAGLVGFTGGRIRSRNRTCGRQEDVSMLHYAIDISKGLGIGLAGGGVLYAFARGLDYNYIQETAWPHLLYAQQAAA